MLLAADKVANGDGDLVETGADLLRRVTVSQCECVVLDGLEVDGDTERCTKLIIALYDVSIAQTEFGLIDLQSNACRY